MPLASLSNAPPRWLTAALVAIGALALVGPILLLAYPPAMPAANPAPVRAVRVVPKAELPPVEPVAFQAVDRDNARAWNASVPFSTAPNPPARPFVFGGGSEDRARAIDCLAAAMIYEAGDDPVGERAVGQVVLNRVRHPAFPKTVCGVVFQGQERVTGCQFTFTCDGAMTRVPGAVAWERARKLAAAAIGGAVVAKVGHSTHYHTDWVVPYWSASLDKVAEVNTHLFFRWTGWWGTPPAFQRGSAGGEPAIGKLAALSPAHALAAALGEAGGAIVAADSLIKAIPRNAAPGAAGAVADDGSFVATLDRKLSADQLPGFARNACGTREYCKLLAWNSKAETPAALPASAAQMATMAFSYLRDRTRGYDKALWNCAIYKRAEPRECMKVQLAPRVAASPRAEPSPAAAVPAVRPTPAPSPARTPPPARS